MDVLTLYEVARQVQEELDEMDERVAYVHLVKREVVNGKLGKERELDMKIESTRYALSFVREPVRDAGYRLHVFGPAVSEEDLQDCMVQEVWQAAKMYLKRFPDATLCESWRLYLRKVLIARIGVLGRRRQVMKDGERFCIKEDAHDLSLEKLFEDEAQRKQASEYLLDPVDMYKEFDDTYFKAAFYATLPPRQQRIVDYLYARVKGYTEYTDTKIANVLGIHRKQLERDVIYIQRAYTAYVVME